MKKFYVLLLLLMSYTAAQTQIKYYAVGPGTLAQYNTDAANAGATYTYAQVFTDLTAVAAFTAGVTSAPAGFSHMYFELQTGYTENVNAPIVFSSTANIKIRPAVWTIGLNTTGDVGAANSLIVFDGAKNLVFDGRPGSVGSAVTDSKWTIDNKTVGNCGPTFKLINNSSENDISYLKIRSGNGVSGAVVFGLSAVNGTFNSLNYVQYCDFSASSSGQAYATAVYNLGSPGQSNADNRITFNQIKDFTHSGVELRNSGLGNAWKIWYNKFYQTAPCNTTLTGVDIQGGVSHSVLNNIFGGGDATGGGLLTVTKEGGPAFVAVKLAVGAAGYNTEVGYNDIKNITASNNATSDPAFYGVWVVSGGANVYENNIGSASIQTNGDTYGVYIQSSDPNQVYKNYFKNMVGIMSGSYKFSAIKVNGNGNVIIWKNNIESTNFASGNTNIDPLTASCAISAEGTPTLEIKDNILAFANQSAIAGAPATIFAIGGGTAQIYSNRIANGSGTNNGIDGPFSGYSIGLYQSGGVVKLFNNYMAFGGANKENIYGIELNTATPGSEYVFNSIYIGGSTGASTTRSYCFYRNSAINSGAQKMMNNLFYNDRTSGTGYAVGLGNTVGWNSANISHNAYLASDFDKVFDYGGINQAIYAWQGVTGERYSLATISDASVTTNLFNNNPSGGDLSINRNNSLCWVLNGWGLPILGYDKDYSLIPGTRSTSPISGSTDIGAYEFTPAAGVLPELRGGDLNYPFETDLYMNLRPGYDIAKIKYHNLGGGTTPVISIQYYPGVQPLPSPPTQAGQTAEVMNCYWDIQATGGNNYSYDLTLYFDPSIVGNVGLDGNVKIMKKSGGNPWEGFSATAADYAANSMTITGQNSFSLFALADATTVVLPVTLEYFNAAKNNSDVVLKWKSAMELDHKSYETERSYDGKNFVSFKTIAPSSVKEYTVTDEGALNKFAGKIYYRLKMISTSNVITYSAVAVIDNTNAKTQAIRLSSENPFTDHIDLHFNNAQTNKTSIMLYDASGKLMGSRTAVLPAGSSSVRLENLNKLSSATYTLKVTTATGGMSMQMIKK